MLRRGVTDRFEIQRSSERLAEMNQAFQFGRARLGRLGVSFGRERMRLGFLALSLLMDEEDEDQDEQRRNQRQAGRALDVARQIQEIADRPREDDDDSYHQAGEQKPVLPIDEIHWIQYFSAALKPR